jgi:uncharacterized protein YegJ (DUF2314 family)
MQIFQYCLMLIICCMLSCNNETGIVSRQEKEGDKTFTVNGEDDAMNEASEKSRKTYPQFLSELSASKDDTSKFGFAVKMRFDYGVDDGEHMWLNGLFLEKNKLFGILDNEPFNIQDIKIGDTIEIIRANISDWIYFSSDTLKGGYTVKVLYKYATPAERKEMEAAYGPTIADFKE